MGRFGSVLPVDLFIRNQLFRRVNLMLLIGVGRTKSTLNSLENGSIFLKNVSTEYINMQRPRERCSISDATREYSSMLPEEWVGELKALNRPLGRRGLLESALN